MTKACAAVFDKSSCSFILTGRPAGTAAKRSMLDKRARCGVRATASISLEIVLSLTVSVKLVAFKLMRCTDH